VLIAVLVVLGPVIFLFGVLDLLRRRPSETPDEHGTGTVVACERRPGLHSDRPVYGLRVVFTAPSGETIEFADNSAVARLVGSDVAVRHEPGAPWSAHVTEPPSGTALRPYGLILAGGLVTIGLAAMLIS